MAVIKGSEISQKGTKMGGQGYSRSWLFHQRTSPAFSGVLSSAEHSQTASHSPSGPGLVQ